MSDARFSEPRLALNRVYTRRGDTGQTSLVGGQRIAKNDLRIEAYGAIDEFNSFIGVARESLRSLIAEALALTELEGILLRVQHELFNAGAILATLPKTCIPNRRVSPRRTPHSLSAKSTA